MPVPADPADDNKVLKANGGTASWQPDDGGGGGGSSLVSTTKISRVIGPHPQTAGWGGVTTLDFTGSTVQDGPDWYGPGTMLALGVTTDTGSIVLPEDDHMYDITVRVLCAGDAADVGKLIGVAVIGDNAATQFYVPLDGSGSATLRGSFTDIVPVGDGPQALSVNVDTSALTVDAIVNQIVVLVAQR